jgi:hypothetical protein
MNNIINNNNNKMHVFPAYSVFQLQLAKKKKKSRITTWQQAHPQPPTPD